MINFGRPPGHAVFRLIVALGVLTLLGGAMALAAWPPPARPDGPGTGGAVSDAAGTAVAPEGATLPPIGGGPGPFIVGDEPQPPHTFGDDARLDGLWTECAGGSGRACDRLFDEAPLASDYERFGVSCGERPEVLHCQEVLDGISPESQLREWPLPFFADDRPTLDLGPPANSR